jgi:20S proteasome alpha/beta subunit
MTLAVAIKATDAIIVAADSRGTIGDPRGLTAVNDTQQKIFQLGSCAVAISGAAEMAQALMDELAKRGLSNPPNIDDAVVSFGQVADIYDLWLRAVSVEHRPLIALLLAGYRRLDGSAPTPMVYLLVSNVRFAPQLAGAYPMMIGVPQYAVYLSHRYYDPNISGDQAAGLAEYLISETASQDPKVGGQIRIAKVLPGSGYKALTDDEVSTLRKRNQKLNDRLRGFFKSGGRK